MNVDYINPFIEASLEIINQATGLSPNLGEVYVKHTPYKSDNLLVLIGLTGEIRGNVVFAFSQQLASKIASAMMLSEITMLDELAKSAISELCNMILGKTSTVFYNNGINIDITPPAMLMGENIQLSIHNSLIVSIPLNFGNQTKMEIDISYIDGESLKG